jgi:hypothetical protein
MFSKRGIIIADPACKALANQWIAEVTVANNSDPLSGIRFGLSQQPLLMYLLTDGAFNNNDAVIAEIRRLNARKQTRINTIAVFLTDAPASDRMVCEDVLRRIAQENGGRFKVVLTSELTQ